MTVKNRTFAAIAVAGLLFVGAGCGQDRDTGAVLSPSGQSQAESVVPQAEAPAQPAAAPGEVKEFVTTSFYEMADGKPKPQFSLTQITVKKGDRVRIKITNTKGNHDFNLDEFGVKAETPLDQEVTVEFTADQAGEFIYYCSKPGHRQAGHWGTLKVLE